MSTSFHQLSESLASLLEAASPAVVRIDAGAETVSGLVWDAHTIVTARHGVTEDAPVTVTLHDGTTRNATLLGHDPRVDLSFLTVSEGGLPARPDASEAALKPGHLVLTVGRSPRGLRSSLGVVGLVGPAWRTRGGAEVDIDIDVVHEERLG